MAEPLDRYSTVSVILHWLIAALILFNLLGGVLMEKLEGPAQTSLFHIHKSTGLTILMLSLVRLGWRLANPWPPLPSAMANWEKLLARAVHVGFYVLMIGIPLVGWATASAWGPASTGRFWGVIPWPDLPTPDSRELYETLGTLHAALALGFLGMLALHVAGALKHQFWSHDDELRRMMPWLKPRGAPGDRAR
jgi:cytochrome b561